MLRALLAAHALAGGGFDRGFSGDGKRVNDLGGSEDLSAVETIGNRKIVVAGHTDLFGDEDFAITRYRRNGALDGSFGANGTAIADFVGDDDQARDLAIDSQGRVVVVGVEDLGGSGDVAVARFRPGGGLDSSFSGNGKASFNFGASDSGSGVAIQRNGKIVISVRTTSGLSDFDLAVLRLKPGGTPDPSFGGGQGAVRTDFGGNELASDVALKGRKIVVAGSADDGADTDFAVARYRAGGGLDGTFSGDGRRLIDFEGDASASSLDTARKGRLLIAGDAGPGSDWGLARLRRGGGLDGTFSGDGRKITDPGGAFDTLTAVAAAGRRIVVAGETNISGGRRFAVARYRSGGGLDGSFAGDGIKSFTINPGAQSEGARDVAIQRNGRIVAAGFTFESFTGDQALVRLRP